MKRTLVPILVVLASGCASHPRHAVNPPAPVISAGKEDLYRHFDSNVVIIGKAEQFPKEGVVVVMNDGTHVMIPELKEWPARDKGMRVSVEGMLQRVEAPTPQQPIVASAREGPSVYRPDDRVLLQGVRWEPGRAKSNPK